MKTPLGQLVVQQKSGSESFHEGGSPSGFSVLDFWRWSASDLVDNTARGVLAEFLVAKALGISTEGVCDSWGAVDLVTASGIRIQVKSSAFLQSWAQRKLTDVCFSVARKRAWHPETNVLDPEPARHADVYVFALLAHRDKATVDPLDLSQWKFFAVTAATLEGRAGSQDSITLRSLEALAGPPVAFSQLAKAFAHVSAPSERHGD